MDLNHRSTGYEPVGIPGYPTPLRFRDAGTIFMLLLNVLRSLSSNAKGGETIKVAPI